MGRSIKKGPTAIGPIKINSSQFYHFGGELKMAYFKTCELCGAHLDPDEKCDCEYETVNYKEEN